MSQAPSKPPGPAGLTIRPARDSDAEAVIALVERCFREYPGCVLDLAGIDADLPAVASRFEDQGGQFWVAEDESGRIVASVGYTPKDEGAVELKRLYVAPDARRRGLATRLLALVLEAARARAASEIVLWSDTRFGEAHAFYLAHGFAQTGESRELNDPSETTEYAFRLALPAE